MKFLRAASGGLFGIACGSAANPCLDQATIHLVETWVSPGALNN